MKNYVEFLADKEKYEDNIFCEMEKQEKQEKQEFLAILEEIKKQGLDIIEGAYSYTPYYKNELPKIEKNINFLKNFLGI